MLGSSELRRQNTSDSGFTLIEVMVAIVLLSICLVGTMQFFASAGDRVMDSETRSLMHQVASKEIEDVRSLPYEDIGTVSGHPPGLIPDQETMTVEGIPLDITREVVYVTDDSYSGPYPANYRRVTITVAAPDSDELLPMQLSTIIAGGADGGTLDITVTDIAGEPVPNARLAVDNENLSPEVHIDAPAIRTDADGHLMIPGLTPDNTNNYYVTATKTGYNSAATPDGLVVVKGTPFTVVSLIIDELCTLRFHVTDGVGNPREDVTLTLTGSLSIYPWVYELTAITNEEGYATFSDVRYATSLEPGVVQTFDTDPDLALPAGIDPDPIDPSITLAAGQLGLMLDPGVTREVELELPE